MCRFLCLLCRSLCRLSLGMAVRLRIESRKGDLVNRMEAFLNLRRIPGLIPSLVALGFFLVGVGVRAQEHTRARDLGIPFDGITGPLNTITDVRGVEVGNTTLI